LEEGSLALPRVIDDLGVVNLTARRSLGRIETAGFSRVEK